MDKGGKYMTGQTNWPEDKKEILKTMGSPEEQKQVDEMNVRIQETKFNKIKIEYYFDNDRDGKNELVRAISADDAFGVLWNIDNIARTALKYNEDSLEYLQTSLEEIRMQISESGLMEFYQ